MRSYALSQTVSLTQSPQDTILVIKFTPNYQKVSTTMEYEHITHSFEPIYNEDSEILILGTLPSVKSRENNFYYGHKQNRFWKLLAKLCNTDRFESDFKSLSDSTDLCKWK